MDEKIKKEFSKNLKIYRLKKNLSQNDLADKLGITAPAVTKWEKGKGLPGLPTLYDLCKLLEIDINDLLGKYALDKSNIELDTISNEDKKTIQKIKELINKLNF